MEEAFFLRVGAAAEGAGAPAEVTAAVSPVEAAVQAEGVQVEAGKVSPIVQAIDDAERRTRAEIRVHLSRRLWDRMPVLKRAWRTFFELGMQETREANAVLLYVNLRLKRFAVVADHGIAAQLNPEYWNQECQRLGEEFSGTYYENAIARSVERIGLALAEHFPLRIDEEDSQDRFNELPNTVSQD